MRAAVHEAPRLVGSLANLLDEQPQRGIDLVRALPACGEDVFHALAWMEARGYAALRPIESGVYGWVTGREALRS